MINDKMAKMAVNTIRAYCDEKKCDTCAVFDTCKLTNGRFQLANGRFQDFNGNGTVGTFEGWQKPLGKTPKFDAKLGDSGIFKDYLNDILLREAPKLGLFTAGLDTIKCYPNGTIKVWYVDKDGETVYKGKAKCHQNDAFNPEIGIKLAVQRIAEKINKPFVPTDGETYYYVGNDAIHIYVNHYENKDVFNIALGNCFKTFEQADAHKDAIMKRIERAKVLLESLREDDVIHQ